MTKETDTYYSVRSKTKIGSYEFLHLEGHVCGDRSEAFELLGKLRLLYPEKNLSIYATRTTEIEEGTVR